MKAIAQEGRRVIMLFSKLVRLSGDHLLCFGRKHNNKQNKGWGVRFLGKGLLVHTDFFKVFFLMFYYLFLGERERQSVSGEGTEREGDTEPRA